MDGRGRCLDNVFIERLWRSLKYEAVYLHELVDGFEAERVIGAWMTFYSDVRPHSALGGARRPRPTARSGQRDHASSGKQRTGGHAGVRLASAAFRQFPGVAERRIRARPSVNAHPDVVRAR
jgi:hypothetical protein